MADSCDGGQIDGYGVGGGKGQCVGEGAVAVPSNPGARWSGPSSEDSGRIAKAGEDIRKPFENVNTQATAVSTAREVLGI